MIIWCTLSLFGYKYWSHALRELVQNITVTGEINVILTLRIHPLPPSLTSCDAYELRQVPEELLMLSQVAIGLTSRTRPLLRPLTS